MTTGKPSVKYWLLTTEYPPFYGGGISTYCSFTVDMLCANNYEVTVFVPDTTISDYRIEEKSPLTVVRFHPFRTKLAASLDDVARLSYEFAMITKTLIATKGKPDVIEAQDYQGIAYFLLQFKRTLDPSFAGVPVILTLHSPAFLYLEYNKVPTYKFPAFWTCEMEKHAMVAADHLVSPTWFLPKALARHIDISKLKVEVIPNPFQSTAVDQPAPASRGKIIYFGKLSPQKGSFELLAYFEQLWKKGYDYQLEVIGGTDIVYHIEMQTMGALVKKKYAAFIERSLLNLRGNLPLDVAAAHVRDAHLIVIPSVIDNLPYAVIEMMSLGKVVLTSVQGGQKEIISHGIDGFLFDHNDPGSFEGTLLQIMALSNDDLLRIGRKAKETIHNKFSFDTIFPKKDQLIRGVIAANRGLSRQLPFLHQQPFDPLHKEGEADLLTVIIPFFNMGGLVRETVESVKRSSYPHIDILVIDDGSTDAESVAVLKDLATSGVRVIKKDNEGLAATRNFGAENARGRFIAFLDADDKVSRDYYEKSVNILKTYENVFFVGCWVQYFENSDMMWPAFEPQPPYLLVHNPLNSSSLVYKKEAFLRAARNDRNLSFGLEDYESVINMMAHGYNGTTIPEPHFFYRIRSGSMFRSLNRNKLIYSYKYITDKHEGYYNKFATQIINLLNSNGPGYLFDNPTEETHVSIRISKRSHFKSMVASYVRKHPKLKELLLKFLRK